MSTNIYDINGRVLSFGEGSGGSRGLFETILIAAADSSDNDKAIADYVCDGVNDEVELNAAMEVFAEKSGTIILATGNYYIGSLISRTYNGVTVKYGILMDHPLSHRQITIKANNYTTRGSQDNADYSISDNMTAVLHLTNACYNSISSTDIVNIIGGYPRQVFPNMCLEVNNLAIKLQGNAKPIIGIDGKYLSILKSEGVVMSCEQSSTVNPKCIGMRSSQGWCEGIQNEIKHSKINGFGCGFLLAGEHLVATEIMPHRCLYGIVIGHLPEVGTFDRTGIHNLTLINCSIEKCKRGLTFGGLNGMGGVTNVVTIIDLNNETFDDAEWVAKETVPGAFYGSISYYNISATTWKPSTLPFWADANTMGKTFRVIRQDVAPTGSGASSPLQGKKILAIGDSFVKGHTLTEAQTWVAKIAARNSMTKYVHATNGASLAYAAGQSTTALVDTLATITASVASADYIVLLAGHNDANPDLNGGSAIPIGANTDTTKDTFKGALNMTITALLNKYPKAKMLALTPFNRRGIEEPYVEAMKEICGIWCVPCFDNYHSSGICFQNSGQAAAYELSSSLHLNEAGQERVADLYESILAGALAVSR